MSLIEPSAKLSGEVMAIIADFLASDDARDALERWARLNHRETWDEFDRLLGEDISAAQFFQDYQKWGARTMSDVISAELGFEVPR